ncbi:MAG: YceI family protein [Bacteroidales bacterium]
MVTLIIDVSQSIIKWNAFKPGGEHDGTLHFKNGTIEVDDQNIPIGGSFEFDMDTITDNDLSGFLKQKLETDLKGTEFFDVVKYPDAKFEIEKVDHTPDTSGYYGVSGYLTMKGVRNEISFKAKYTEAADSIRVESNKIIVDRTKWGINHGSKNIFKKLQENIIADNFDVQAIVVAKTK